MERRAPADMGDDVTKRRQHHQNTAQRKRDRHGTRQTTGEPRRPHGAVDDRKPRQRERQPDWKALNARQDAAFTRPEGEQRGKKQDLDKTMREPEKPATKPKRSPVRYPDRTYRQMDDGISRIVQVGKTESVDDGFHNSTREQPYQPQWLYAATSPSG